MDKEWETVPICLSGLQGCDICFKCCFPEYYYSYDGYNPMDSFDPDDIVIRVRRKKMEKQKKKRMREVFDRSWYVFIQNK